MRDHIHRHLPKYALWDVRHASLHKIEPALFRPLLDNAGQSFSRRGAGARTGFVVSQHYDFVMMQSFIAFLGLRPPEARIEYKVFMTIDECRDWFRSGE